MLTQKGLNNAQASRASILMKTGACVGGTIIGYLSQFVGRRRAIILSAFMSGVIIPAWILPQGERSLSCTGFFIQFFVQGAWGVIPIHLNELSPPAFRSSFPGLSFLFSPLPQPSQLPSDRNRKLTIKTGITYQVGNMISSPSAQIVNAIAEATTVTGANGQPAPAYGPTMGVATAIIATGIMVTTAFGPEKRGRRFETAVAGLAEEEEKSPKEIDLERGHELEVEGKVVGSNEDGDEDEKKVDEKVEKIEKS